MAPAETGDQAERSAARTAFRLPLLLALVLSAAAALLVQPQVVMAVRAERLHAGWLVVTPAVFSLAVVIAALDAWRTARRRGYFRGPSLVAVAASVAFLGLLLPDTFSEYRARTSPPESSARDAALFVHRDPRVRALVMEVAGYRSAPATEVAPLLTRGLADRDPMVVQAAVAAVARRSGIPLEGPEAAEKARQIVAGW